MTPQGRLLIAHVIFRLDVGGLENGLVNLVNCLPANQFRHAIICIDEVTSFRKRINRDNVEFVAIGKKPGQDLGAYWRLARVLRRLAPDILHTRNLAGLDGLLPAVIAGIKVRIHSEHGWRISDVEGNNQRARLLRRLYSPLVTHYVALSKEIADYLADEIRINREHITQVINGVDTDKFCPSPLSRRQRCELIPNVDGDSLIVGTVGRLRPVKNQACLVHAFEIIAKQRHALSDRLRLVVIGDGPQFAEIRQQIERLGLARKTWMPGTRDDIPRILQSMDLFVQPSLAEGISNTILEAMACQLPVIATNVGGNSELVEDHQTGILIPPSEPNMLAEAIREYAENPALMKSHGEAARARTIRSFGLPVMINAYKDLYDEYTHS